MYVYPTPRAYLPTDIFALSVWPKFGPDLNLYFHIPFCDHRCTFCAYFLTVTKSGIVPDLYVDTLLAELELYRPIIGRDYRRVNSINFGGGTPSLLSPKQLGRLIEAIYAMKPETRSCPEISIEATPESVRKDTFEAFKKLGINRVSMEIETLDDSVIHAVNRRNTKNISIQALEILKSIGFENVCIDLMLGLENQTALSFRETVETVVSYSPETIELYATVTVPHTARAKRIERTSILSGVQQYDSWHWASEYILSSGYRRDSHVRFVKKDFAGGYLQQKNIFAGQNLIGLGAAARSYADNMHYRNINQPNPMIAINEYCSLIEHNKSVVRSLVWLPPEERIPQAIIYNLEHLEFSMLQKKFGCNFLADFGSIVNRLVEDGYAVLTDEHFELTPAGLYVRDGIAQLFFSEKTRILEDAYHASATQ